MKTFSLPYGMLRKIIVTQQKCANINAKYGNNIVNLLAAYIFLFLWDTNEDSLKTIRMDSVMQINKRKY